MTIRFRLSAIFLSLVSIPLIFVGAITFYNNEQALQAARMAQLQDVARFKAGRVETYFVQLKSGMELVQTFYNIRKNLPLLARSASTLGAPAFLQAREMLDLQMGRTQTVLGLANIMLADTNGTVVYVSNPRHVAADLLQPLAGVWPAGSPFDRGRFCLSQVVPSRLGRGSPEIFAIAPVADLSGAPCGTIVFEVDMAPLYALIQDTTGLGVTGEVLLCKRSGSDLVYINPLRHDSTAALNRRVVMGTDIALPAQNALNGETGVGRSIDYRDVKVIAAWLPIPSLDWGLVAKIDMREAFEAVTNLKRLVMVILAVALMMAGLITLFVTRSISRPILALSKGTAIIGRGNLDHKVGTAARDEIGNLSRAFDNMTHDLKETLASRNELNREVAERRKAQQDLLRSNQDLEQFAYVASHDLQEPLRAVAGFMGLLKNQYRAALNPEAQEYIDLSVEGAERMQTLIHDLLAFSRVGSKGGTFGPMRLRDAADAAQLHLQAAIAESGAVVTCGELPLVTADLLQMTQLMQNLIGNAIKFRGKRTPEIRVSAVRGDGFWDIGVRDNGIGIEPQYFDKIFLIFQRLHTRSEYPGTGIGLAICKKIVERHGGALRVESTPGEGTVFHFTIPDKGENR